MVLVCFLHRVLVCFSDGLSIGIVLFVGMVLLRFWYCAGVILVWCRCGFCKVLGLLLVLCCYVLGILFNMVLVCVWYGVGIVSIAGMVLLWC